jgi:vancomycin resistance protein VanJ
MTQKPLIPNRSRGNRPRDAVVAAARAAFLRMARGVLAPRDRRIIVRCARRTHRVQLAAGKFWRNARCPTCKAAVDPFRVRRIGRWLLNSLRPRSTATTDRVLWGVTLAYLATALAAAWSVWMLADHWWPATVLLFGPRWVLALPLLVLAPAILWRDRALLASLALSACVVLGPVIGLRTGWRRLFVSPAPSDVRVMTFNTEGGRAMSWAPGAVLEALGVEVAAFQECSGRLVDAINALHDWHTDTRESACLVSRFPIRSVTEMDRDAFVAAGGAGLVVTYRLDVNGRDLYLTNVHLETPRAGLELLREGRVAEGAPTLEGKSFLRDIEHRFARRWVDTLPSPRLVVGDFNSPPESPMFRSHWGDWQNAFSRVGWGLGGSRVNGWIRARIDHILADTSWTVVRSWLGPDLGSDHLPMLAELRLH